MSEQNPLDVANEATLAPQVYFGQILLDAYFCALVKGIGKVPFDPAQHEKRFTAINLTLAPFAGSKATYQIEREYVAEFKEWAGTVLPSIRALGLTPTSINNRWVKAEMVKTGTYTKNGEVKDLTSPKIVTVFESEEACANAANAFFTRPTIDNDDDPFPKQPNLNNGTTVPKALMSFVTRFIEEAGGDIDKLAEKLNNPTFTAYNLTVEHPAVVTALLEYEARQLAAAQQ